jgi:hypothetical protein
VTYHELSHQCEGFVELVEVKRERYEEFEERQSLLLETQSVRAQWRHPPVAFSKYDWLGKRISRRSDPATFESDAPGHTLGLALSGRAADALRNLWERYGELLPVPSEDGEFHMFHCMNEIDAIDNVNCEFNGGTIKKYAMKLDVVHGQHIFRVSQPYKYSTIFVSDLVISRINGAGLRGFKFEPLWSEETGTIIDTSLPTAVKEPEHALGSRPMSKSARRDIVDKLVRDAKQVLGINLATDPAAEVLERIRQEGVSAREAGCGFQDLVGLGMVLGSLWGELVCRDFGWHWAMVKRERGEAVGIVSSSCSHVAFPHRWFSSLLTNSGDGPSSVELYDMIKTGSLPPAEPQAMLVVV